MTNDNNNDVKSFLERHVSGISKINLLLRRKSCTAYNHSHALQSWISIAGSTVMGGTYGTNSSFREK